MLDMNKRPWLKRVVSATLLGGLLLGSVGIAYAADSDTVATAANNVKSKIHSMMPGGRGHGHGPGMMGGEMGLGMNLDLDVLVKDGVITSDESAAIQAKIDTLKAERQAERDKIQAMTAAERQAYFESKKAENDKNMKTDFLTTLVNEKIISSDKAEAIRTAQQAQRQGEMQSKLTADLTTLVDDGTITSGQHDAILAALQEQQKQRQAEMEKVRAMTEAERAAYFEANKPAGNNCLADLVTAGTITQAQADAVRNVIGGPRGNGRGSAPGATCENCSNNNCDRPAAAPGQGGFGGGKGHGGMGRGGMGQGQGAANSSFGQSNAQ